MTATAAGSTTRVTVPSVTTRGVGAGVELVLYLLATMAVALVEYFVAGPFSDFGPSNFWLGFAVFAAVEGWLWAGSQTAAGTITGQYIAMADGTPASTLTIAVRQLSRFGVLYGIPILAFEFDTFLPNNLMILGLGAAVGLMIWRTPGDVPRGTSSPTRSSCRGSVEPASAKTRPPSSPQDLRLDSGRARSNRRAGRVVFGLGLSSVVVSALIVYNIFSEAFEFIDHPEFAWTQLTDIGWIPRRGAFDLSTLVLGTLWVTGIAMLVAGPVGLGVAFYLSEYASPRVRGIVKPLIETLASIPSVVLGLFAISFIAPTILQPLNDEIGIFSLLAAGAGVGVLTVPIVASISEDAMRAVPLELREASFGLGGRKATTALRVVFPAAISGISAAFIVGISRAIGETMVVFLAAGGSGSAIFELDPRAEGQTFTAAMASLGAGTDNVAGVGSAFQSLYFLGALLFVVTMLLNLLSDVIVRRFRQVY